MNPNNPQGFGRPNKSMFKPDIDDLIAEFKQEVEEAWGMHEKGSYMNPEGVSSEEHFKQALYRRLAAEASELTLRDYGGHEKLIIKAVPLSKLKAIMEIKE